MASKKITTDVVRPIISANREEARLRALRLYRMWYRSMDYVVLLNRGLLPKTANQLRQKLREEFEKNRNLTDLRIIDIIIYRSQQDLREVVNLHAQQCHILGKWFKETVNPRPNTFLSKFFSNSDSV